MDEVTYSVSEWLKAITSATWSVSKDVVFLLLVLYVAYHAIVAALSLLNPLFPVRFSAWIERLSHQKSAKDLVREALAELGYRPSSMADVIAANDRQLSRLIGVTDDGARLRLCRLLSKCTRELPSAMFYGRETPEKTEYYVDTIGSSVEPSVAEEMSTLMQYLISQRPSGSKSIDFVLVPKSGNVLLGHTLSRMWGYYCIFRKDEGSSSRARAGNADLDPNGVMINLEGLQALLDGARKAGRPFYGVAVDCNCSGGSSIVRAIEEWNRVAVAHDDIVMPVSEAFILYRPDRSELSNVCSDGQPVHFSRFLDLSEVQKRDLAGSLTEKKIRKLAREVTTNGS